MNRAEEEEKGGGPGAPESTSGLQPAAKKPRSRRRGGRGRRRKKPAAAGPQAAAAQVAVERQETASARPGRGATEEAGPPPDAEGPAETGRETARPASDALTEPPAGAAEPSQAPSTPGGEAAAGELPRKRRRRRGRGGRGRGRQTTAQTSSEKTMLMNAVDPGEVRVAVIEDGQLAEVYLERARQHLIAGNIYRAKVTNVSKELQAAFVDLGVGRNGFLHGTDCIPPDGGHAEVLGAPPKKSHGRFHRIEEMLQRGQDVLVQVTKESIGQKGPSVTTYLSVPGRFLVLMPGLGRLGVSKKIDDERLRDELKSRLQACDPPPDLGFIVRTAGLGRTQEEFKADLDYLVELWESLKRRAAQAKSPTLIYEESDLHIRAVRDTFTEDTSRVIVDSEEVFGHVRDFLKTVMPDQVGKLELYRGPEPIFHKYNVEEQLNRLLSRRVALPGGGSLVIEQTEAMVAIDVNSGGGRGAKSNRDLILKTNLEAVREVARQLKLRDIGGLVMIDLIDMDELADRREVEAALKQALARDKARVRVAPVSEFGIVEMTRQRVREGLQRALFEPCPACGGTGLRKTAESVGLDSLRAVKVALGEGAGRVQVTLNPEVALYVANRYRNNMVELEQRYRAEIILRGNPGLAAGEMRVDTLEVGERE